MFRQVRRLTSGLVFAASALAISVAPAGAAAYTTYVGCSDTASAMPSHVCEIGDQPGAFFESPTADVEYEVCVSFPSGQTLCAEEQLAETEVLYVNSITTEIPGNHLVTWYVEGIEVAAWSFRMDPPPAPPPAAPPRPAPAPAPAPPVALMSTIGCAGYASAITFVAEPKRCVVFRQGRRSRGDEIWMRNLGWRAWGKESAVALGRWKHCATADSCASGPLKAVAFRLVPGCGHLAYTRLSVHIVNSAGRDRDYLLSLPAC